MKILLTCENIALKGGAERVVVNIANELYKSGYEVEILSYFKDSYSPKACYFPLNENIQINYLYNYDKPKRKGISRFIWRIFGYIIINLKLNKTAQADIIIENSFSMLYPKFKVDNTKYIKIMHIQISRYKKRKNSYFDALVFLSQSEYDKWGKLHRNATKIANFIQIPFDSLNQTLQQYNNQSYKGLSKHLYNTLSSYLINTDIKEISYMDIESRLAKLNIYQNKLDFVIARFALLAISNTNIKETLTNIGRKYKILSIGRMANDDQKGFPRLIRSYSYIAREFPHWRLEIIGSDYGQKTLLEALIQELDMQDYIFLRDFTSDIQKEYLSADIYAMSSYNEGMPMVLIEAMGNGLPIIAYDIHSIRECFDDNGFLIEHGDKQEQLFSKSLKTLMQDSNLRISMGQQSLILAKQNFSKETIMKQYLNLLNSLVSHNT